jgi:hypothetical protein
MSPLVRFYPRAWRERYLEEFAEVLAERPASFRDQVDIALGALDAWAHPQVVDRSSRSRAGARGRRSLATVLASVLGGALFVAAGLSMNATPVDPGIGNKVVDLAILLLIVGMALTAGTAIALARTSPTRSGVAVALGAAMLVGAMLMAMPWPILAIGFLGYGIASLLFGLLLAPVGLKAVGALLSISAFLLLSANTEDERALLTIPIGLVWVAIGALALRPAPAPAPA